MTCKKVRKNKCFNKKILKINKKLFPYPSEHILINSEAIRNISNYIHFAKKLFKYTPLLHNDANWNLMKKTNVKDVYNYTFEFIFVFF